MNELCDLGITQSIRFTMPSFCVASSRQAPIQIVYSGAAMTSGESIYLGGQVATWVLEAAKKLEALGQLPAGWDSYGGVPLKQGAKDLTVRTLGWLRMDELPVPSVVLCSGGTVQLEWRHGDKELEVELRDSNAIEYLKVSLGGEVEEGEATANLPARLHDLSRWLLR